MACAESKVFYAFLRIIFDFMIKSKEHLLIHSINMHEAPGTKHTKFKLVAQHSKSLHLNSSLHNLQKQFGCKGMSCMRLPLIFLPRSLKLNLKLLFSSLCSIIFKS